MSNPKIYIKVGNQPEFSLTDKVSGLSYLGQDDSGSSPQIINNYQQITGKDGQQFLSETFDKRTVNEKFNLDFMDYEDLIAAKHEIYSLLVGTRQTIRVRHSVNMAKAYFAYPLAFDITPISNGANIAQFTIPFDVPSGYWDSIVRSDGDFSSANENIGYELGFPDSSVGKFTFNTKEFTLYNPSDVPIDPYYENHDMKIYFSFSGNSFKLTNTTNGTSYSYNKASNKRLWFDGLNTYEFSNTNADNTLNSNTDGNTITLDKKENHFTVTGCSSCTVTFSFPFLYLI